MTTIQSLEISTEGDFTKDEFLSGQKGRQRYFWNMVTGDLVETDDERIILLLLADGYIKVSRERFTVVADVRLERG